MQSITLRSQVGSDGILQIQLPLGLRDIDLEVMVIFQPLYVVTATAIEARGCPSGFFDQTVGALANDPLVRGEQ